MSGMARVVRLGDGVWALPEPDGVWVGVLGGDIDSGWRSHVEQIPTSEMPAAARALNLGHCYTSERITIRTAGAGVLLDLVGGHHAVLDDAAAARLQILCAGAPRTLISPPEGRPLPVGSARGGLRVYDVCTLGHEPTVTGLTAAPGPVVMLNLTTSLGPFSLPLPALPVLLAAAEASCDDTMVTLRLDDLVGRATVVRVDAAAAQRAAADAQWLIPALYRQLDDGSRPRS